MSNLRIPPIPLTKRIFDVVVSLIILVLTLPLWMFLLIIIFLEHILRGHPFDPLFYREIRISRGKKFFLYKFNIFDQRVIDTLRKNGIFIHTKNLEYEDKLILIGKVLRQIYLDELPQLFNVIRGDMSLVGPRPLNEEVYNSIISTRVPAQALLLAGITGLFQSYKGKDGKTSAELDKEYIRQFLLRSGPSLVLYDLTIIFRTVKVILRARGI